MMLRSGKSFYARASTWLARLAWALLFLTLTVTSFPFFPGGFGGRTLIRPLAVYPLLLLLVIVTLPRLLRRPLPRTLLPLLAFALAATLSSLVALTFAEGGLRGVSLSERLARNLATLAIGGAFYLTVCLYVERWADLRQALRWLYAGFGLALLWGSLQAVYVVYFYRPYFRLLSEIQGFISTRRLFETRISGPTYEPKWFAEQISFLLLPWLLAAVITRRSLFRWRLGPLTVEWLLLVWAGGVLIFTFSRTGMVMLLLLILLSFLLFYRERRAELQRGDDFTAAQARPQRRKLILRSLAVVAVVALAAFVAGSRSPYFSRLWRYWAGDRPPNKTYLEFIALTQRWVYVTTGLGMFGDHPLTGVGLGNYAFYFDEYLPIQPWDRQPEIVRQITPAEGSTQLITPKNLVVRLLAETGLVGTALFFGFVASVVGCVLLLWFAPGAERRFWAVGGTLALMVFALAVFGFDSFAIPNIWVVFGLLTAAAHLPDEKAGPLVGPNQVGSGPHD